MLKKLNNWIGWRAHELANLAKSLGVELGKVSDLELKIHKLNLIEDLEERLRVTKELVKKYPQHPDCHLELAKCLDSLSDPNSFEQLDRYGEVRREWLGRTGLGELDTEFLPINTAVGSLGNVFSVEGLLKANQCGLRRASKPFLLFPENAQLRNPAFFEYFEPHLKVIREKEAIRALKRLESLLVLPLGIGLPMNNCCPFLDLAANRIELEREKLGLESALFQLNDRHREMGGRALKKLGLPDDAWYVTVHVREPGYRGETPENTTERWRNANPLDYVKALEAVTNAGGWVFRMGDASMTPLPSMPQVIDYARHEIRCDWMDVFLGATCRFLIGTGSGYIHIPALFGVPCIQTNFPGFIPYLGLRKNDLYLPRLLRDTRSKRLLSFEQYMSPPHAMFHKMNSYTNANLEWVENTPEELNAATKEMLQRTASGATLLRRADDDLQLHFKATAENCGRQFGGRPVKAFTSVSRNFLEQHRDLL